jgi:hypothetical protein
VKLSVARRRKRVASVAAGTPASGVDDDAIGARRLDVAEEHHAPPVLDAGAGRARATPRALVDVTAVR